MTGRMKWQKRAVAKRLFFFLIVFATASLEAAGNTAISQTSTPLLRTEQGQSPVLRVSTESVRKHHGSPLSRLARVRSSGANALKAILGTVTGVPNFLMNLRSAMQRNSAAVNVGIISTTVGLVKVCLDEGLRRSIFFWTNAFPVYVHYRYFRSHLRTALCYLRNPIAGSSIGSPRTSPRPIEPNALRRCTTAMPTSEHPRRSLGSTPATNAPWA